MFTPRMVVLSRVFNVRYGLVCVATVTPVSRFTKSADIIEGEYIFQYKADAREQFNSAMTKLKTTRKDLSEVSVSFSSL